MSMKFEIKGMHCKSCKMLIQDVLDEQGVKVISMDVDEKTQTASLVVEDIDPKKVISAIEAEGEYKVVQK